MKIGSNDIDKIYLGSAEVDKIYLGLNLVYTSAIPILDTYAAHNAYSLRNLKTGVTNVIRVRRSSDNAEQDFTAKQITDGTLLTFVGAGDGQVTTMYEQVEGTHPLVQTDPLRQPYIVTSGVLETDNGKPCLRFFTSFLQQSFGLASDPSSQLIVFNQRVNDSANLTDNNNSVGGYSQYLDGGTMRIANDISLTSTLKYSIGTQSIAFRVRDSIDQLYLNGVQYISGNAGFKTQTGLVIGRHRTTSQNYLNGTFQEYIHFSNNEINNLDDISSNVNNYYNMYGTEVFDPDYQAILDRAAVLLLAVPSYLQRVKQNQLVLDLKASGAWEKEELIYVPANDGSIEFGKINWKDPSSNYLTVAPLITFKKNYGLVGYESNTVAAVANTGFLARLSTKFTIDSNSVTLYCTEKYQSVLPFLTYFEATNGNVKAFTSNETELSTVRVRMGNATSADFTLKEFDDTNWHYFSRLGDSVKCVFGDNDTDLASVADGTLGGSQFVFMGTYSNFQSCGDTFGYMSFGDNQDTEAPAKRVAIEKYMNAIK